MKNEKEMIEKLKSDIRTNNNAKASIIVEYFEDFLREKNIYIPCDDKDEEKERKDNEAHAQLYGTEYWGLIDKVEEVLNS